MFSSETYVALSKPQIELCKIPDKNSISILVRKSSNDEDYKLLRFIICGKYFEKNKCKQDRMSLSFIYNMLNLSCSQRNSER